MLASKIYESYILDWLKTEVTMRDNQYGGIRGLGTDHVLVQLWQTILCNAEDYRSGTVITAIDYSKAFNCMSFQECLKALAKNGASRENLELVATFLSNRTMTVKVGNQVMSAPRAVSGGCPQGSILGVFLFNATIDDLEEGCRDLTQTKPEAPQTAGVSSDSVLAELLRYIDDGFCLSKVNFENSIGFKMNGEQLRIKHAVQAQNVFRHLVRRAEEIGMAVNARKTAMICTSGAADYRAVSYILDADENRTECTDSIKALGVHFSSSLNLNLHVDTVVRRFRQRYWTLRNLKRNGFNSDELIQVYKTMLRPIAEYACMVFHSSYTDE